jgi:hypothetical protein
MRTFVPGLLALVLFFAACGSSQQSAGTTGTGRGESPAASEPAPGRLYQVSATVLEDESHGPMLCLGAMLLSLPPQCGDVPITNWHWRQVKADPMSGTISGAYHLIGGYDGKAFTVIEIGPYNPDFEPGEGTYPGDRSPCPEPEGGWPADDRLTPEDTRPAHAYARSQASYVASWSTHLQPKRYEFSPVVFNAVFAGDSERHESAIRGIWDGPLCVVERNVPTADELARIRREVEASLDELGLQMLSSSGPDIEPIIQIGVVVDPEGKAQATLDTRYGPGVVRLVPALRPVER